MTTGLAPEPRAFHTLVAIGGHLFVFGGKAETSFLGDLHRLDVAAGLWTDLTLLSGEGSWPAARAYHACIARDGRLYLFGGWGGAGVSDSESTQILLSWFPN